MKKAIIALLLILCSSMTFADQLVATEDIEFKDGLPFAVVFDAATSFTFDLNTGLKFCSLRKKDNATRIIKAGTVFVVNKIVPLKQTSQSKDGIFLLENIKFFEGKAPSTSQITKSQFTEIAAKTIAKEGGQRIIVIVDSKTGESFNLSCHFSEKSDGDISDIANALLYSGKLRRPFSI